jgi:glycosyltransferase involved in cell wall biosynthesis
MHVLLSAYACRPNSGSEEGNGWGWATHLAARGIRVHVLTIARDQLAIEAEQQRHPIPNLSFSFVEPAVKGLKWGHGLHYLAWQFAAVGRAKKLLTADPFDLVHHVTYGSIHVPSQLWRLGIPVVFGPVGGGQTSPFSMRHYFGKDQQKELLRTAFTKMLRFSPLHRRWIKQMAVVFVTNQETLTLVKQLGRKDAVLALDVCVTQTFLAEGPRIFQECEDPLRLLWTGRMMPRKALALTLDAVSRARENVTLTIVGDGIAPEVVRQMIASRGLESKVFWKGTRVPWSEMRELYREHDAFLFTSLRDSCGGQLLEALALGLPVITLDHQGARLLTPDEAGYKVPVTGKEATISAIAAAIDAFASSSVQQRNAMSAAGLEAARNLTFGVRAKRAEHLYGRILAAHEMNRGSRSDAGQITITDVTPI